MSNIINLRKYGDIENLKRDITTIREILNRQGNNFVIDVIAESVGDCAQLFKLNDNERDKLMNSLIHDFNNALSERL